MLQQRYLQHGGGAQKGPPTTVGRGGATDKSQGGGGVELEAGEHGRPAEEGMVSEVEWCGMVWKGIYSQVIWLHQCCPIGNCLFVNSVECGGML